MLTMDDFLEIATEQKATELMEKVAHPGDFFILFSQPASGVSRMR